MKKRLSFTAMNEKTSASKKKFVTECALVFLKLKEKVLEELSGLASLSSRDNAIADIAGLIMFAVLMAIIAVLLLAL